MNVARTNGVASTFQFPRTSMRRAVADWRSVSIALIVLLGISGVCIGYLWYAWGKEVRDMMARFTDRASVESTMDADCVHALTMLRAMMDEGMTTTHLEQKYATSRRIVAENILDHLYRGESREQSIQLFLKDIGQ